MAHDPSLPEYVDSGSPSDKAQYRKDRIEGSESGPFASRDVTNPGEPELQAPPKRPLMEEIHKAFAEGHQALADLYAKYIRPGTDTIPHTTTDKTGIDDEVDVGHKTAPPTPNSGAGFGVNVKK